MHSSNPRSLHRRVPHVPDQLPEMILPPQPTASTSHSHKQPSRPAAYGHPLPTSPPALPPLSDSPRPRDAALGLSQRRRHHPALDPRDATCADVGNDQLSCEPSAGNVVVQGGWFNFTWSRRNPYWNQVNDVDIYLFHADSGEQISQWRENKSRGSIPVAVNDSIWGTRGTSIQSGRNATFPLYFVIIPETATVHNGEPSQPIFTAIQTTLPDSVLLSSTSALSVQSVQSSLSTASIASATSDASYLSSISQASVYSTSSLNTSASSTTSARPSGSGGSGPGGLQGGSGGSHFPNWGIALITVLGFLAILAGIALAYICMRRVREPKQRPASMGSSSPMMAPLSPVHQSIPGAGAAGGSVLARDSSVRRQNTDGASILSGGGSDGGPFSNQDAAILASAFRTQLRKPDLAGRPDEEGESPDEINIIEEELSKEGTDLRHVGSPRPVRVEDSSSGHGV